MWLLLFTSHSTSMDDLVGHHCVAALRGGVGNVLKRNGSAIGDTSGVHWCRSSGSIRRSASIPTVAAAAGGRRRTTGAAHGAARSDNTRDDRNCDQGEEEVLARNVAPLLLSLTVSSSGIVVTVALDLGLVLDPACLPVAPSLLQPRHTARAQLLWLNRGEAGAKLRTSDGRGTVIGSVFHAWQVRHHSRTARFLQLRPVSTKVMEALFSRDIVAPTKSVSRTSRECCGQASDG